MSLWGDGEAHWNPRDFIFIDFPNHKFHLLFTLI